MKKAELLSKHNEQQKWAKEGSILVDFNRSRINDWYKEHGQRVNTLMGEIEKLQSEYLVIKDEVITLSEDGKTPLIVEGKTIEDFNQAWQDLMNQSVSEGLKLFKP